ncbi:MAG TPA: hypothetical protein VEC92_01470 [Nitrososphaerales archaeon]|nr:hypothetical protein [Nitrososphaerales archaeon]
MRLPPLIGISVVAWLLVIVETYLFFDVIIPVGPALHSIGVFTAIALLKIGLTFGLGVLWFFVMVSLTEIYERSLERRLTPTPSS